MREEQRDWFREFAAEVEDEIGAYLRADDRFESSRLFDRFRSAADRLLDQGLDHLSEFVSIHNELCVARWILGDEDEATCVRLEYEPPLGICDKRIDFKCAMRSGATVWVEVKTIRPDAKDAWERYRRAIENEFLLENVFVHFEKDWLGGEFWHNKIAARAKMLEHTVELERTIAKCAIEDAVVLALFSNGFRWHHDELEDFVIFYRRGVHHQGDPLGKMEEHYMRDQQIVLTRQLRAHAFLRRPEHRVLPDRVIWDVQVPDLPWL